MVWEFPEFCEFRNSVRKNLTCRWGPGRLEFSPTGAGHPAAGSWSGRLPGPNLVTIR